MKELDNKDRQAEREAELEKYKEKYQYEPILKFFEIQKNEKSKIYYRT